MPDENDRARTARDHDDIELTEGSLPTPGQGGSAGGALQRDVGSEAEEGRVRDPETHERPTKKDDIANDDAYPSDRAPKGGS